MSEEEKAQARASVAGYEERRQIEAQRLAEGHERALGRLAGDWSLPTVVRSYESNVAGEDQFQREAVIFARHHYQPAMQSTEGSHLHAGRLLLTGGLSVFAGRSGIRSKGKLSVTFQRQEPAEQRAPCWQCRELVIVGAAKCRFCGAELYWPPSSPS